jgi:GR25 family glycosyltransferase involved in LPS biosynthesis
MDKTNIVHDKYNYINNIDIIYWINLDESIDRKDNMICLLNHFDIKNQRIEAINGNSVKDIHKEYFYNETNNYPNYTNKEYAILLSHLNTIELFSKLEEKEIKYGIGLICEDDLSFDFIHYWNKDIRTIVEEAPENWDIIMLGYFSLNIHNKELYKKWDNEWSAISYLVNYKSIKKINNLKKNDKWICKDTDLMVSDNYIFSKLNTYIYKYPYFTFPNNNDSTFHNDHIDYHKIYKISNYITHEEIYDKYNQ